MKLCLLSLIVVIALTACGPAAREAAIPSPTVAAIAASPSPTPPPSATPTPFAASTATPGVSPLLPVLAENCFTDYPAAIGLPEGNAGSYRLKSWSTDSAFELIRTIDENSPPCGEYWTGAEPVFSTQNARRRAAQLAVREAILRYPENPNRDLLDWRLALNNALMGYPSSDAWLLDQLLQALNSGRAAPETLGSFAALYSFEILQAEPANNLFADGKPAYAYWLSAYQGRGNGMYFALRINPDQSYTIYPLLSSWDVNMGTSGGLAIEDHTKDGIPEVVVMRSFRNGSFCWDKLNVYQWDQDRFRDLTVQGVGSGDEGCDTYFDKPDARGFDTIHTSTFTVSRFFNDTYQWNDSFYELAERDTNFWIGNSWDAVNRIESFNEQGKYSKTEQLIQQALANLQDVYVQPDAEYNFRDYLQFQLGWTKALEGDVTGAKELLQSVAASPADSGNQVVSRAAQEFLRNYATGKDLYRACQAADHSMDQDGSTSICHLPTALVLLSRDWTMDQYNDPRATLAEDGVEVAASARLDVDGDGTQDWVFSVKKPWRDLVDLYILRVAGKDSSLAYLDYADEFLAPFEVHAIDLPGSERPTLFLQSGRDFYSFQVVAGRKHLDVYFIQSFGDVRRVELSGEVGEPFEFKVNYFAGDYIPDWETYRWDETFRRFLIVDEQRSAAQRAWEGPVMPAQQAEAKLLVEGKPAEAITLLKQVLAMPNVDVDGWCWMPGNCLDESRLRYLLALSYELTGDEAKAIQTYWQLWHDDPGSAYAVLARAKLEQVP